MVDSCRSCPSCKAGIEQYCQTGSVFTYNGTYKYEHCAEYTPEGGAPTYGGYSARIVVVESFVLKVPKNINLAAAAPLLCAGITVYSPMIHFGLNPSLKLAVLGLGGLGHMAVKFGVAFGCHVTVVSRGTAKKTDALVGLRANHYVDSTDPEAMAVKFAIFV